MYSPWPSVSCCEISTGLGFEDVDFRHFFEEDFPWLSAKMSFCDFIKDPDPRTTYRGYKRAPLVIGKHKGTPRRQTFHKALPIIVPRSGGTNINPSITIILPEFARVSKYYFGFEMTNWTNTRSQGE